LFEKVAKDLNWPLDKYTILLQCVLKGKACDIYLSLSAEQTSDYQVVKAIILKGYQLVSEAYRQKFRHYKIRVITKLPNSEQSYKGKVKTHNYINRQNQSTTGKLGL
jgi:hypothetical protein